MRWISIEARHASLDSQLPVQWKEPFVYTERERERESESEDETFFETRAFKSSLLASLTSTLLYTFFRKITFTIRQESFLRCLFYCFAQSIDSYSSVRDGIIFSFAKCVWLSSQNQVAGCAMIQPSRCFGIRVSEFDAKTFSTVLRYERKR